MNINLGDIVPMGAMTPIDVATLFTTDLPTPVPLGTRSAPLANAAYPTFRPGFSDEPGTVLGPAGAYVPTQPTSVESAILSGNGAMTGPPAATPDQAIDTGMPAGPITFLPPLPSITRPPITRQFSAPAPSFGCRLNQWVSENPLGALVGLAALYFVLKPGARK